MVALTTRLLAYSQPLILLSVSLVFLPITLLQHPLLAVSSPSRFRSKWFEGFWKVVGPKMAASPDQVDHIESIMSRVRGVGLELGPGAGDQSYHLKPGQITKLYGAEPNVFLHEPLLANAQKAGLKEHQYEPLTCGAEPGSLLPALKNAGLIPSTMQTLPPEGIFDSIIAVKALCSAPQPQLPATIAIVQSLLKPGGEFLFFEHVASEADPATRSFVWCVNLVWPYIMGGCNLDGRLDKVVNGMGGWASRDIGTIGEHKGFEPFRYVSGVCVKA